MATIKEIARLAGVSRGTVDRVLNHRGDVKPETAEKVMEIARALDYTPNLAGRNLAVRKKRLRFGVVLFSSTTSNPFFQDVVRGIDTRAAELAQYGVRVEVRTAMLDEVDRQLRAVDELVAEGVDGLVITPINHERVRARLAELTADGLPVVTANSDIAGCGRMAYVGCDFERSGAAAGGLFRLLCREETALGVVMGSPEVMCHSERVAGLERYLAGHAPHIRVAAHCVNNDDDLESYAATRRMLQENPGLGGLYLASAGAQGACRAVESLGLLGKLVIVGNDTTPAIRDLMRSGAIAATIGQQPFIQGAKPLDILMEAVTQGKPPEQEVFHTQLEIYIPENL